MGMLLKRAPLPFDLDAKAFMLYLQFVRLSVVTGCYDHGRIYLLLFDFYPLFHIFHQV